MLFRRNVAAKQSYAYRHTSLSMKDCRRLRRVKKVALLLAVKLSMEDDTDIASHLQRLLTLTLHRYRQIMYCHVQNRTCRKNRQITSARTIESFSEAACWKRFRTTKSHLLLLLKAFKFEKNDGEYFIADNGSKFTGEEILLIGLHRYCIPGPLEQTMGEVFKLDFSMLSRAFKIFNTHMIQNYAYLLTNNLEYWKPFFPTYANCIKQRLAEAGDIHYADGTFRVFGFHDDTVIATCRPGSGPTVDGERHDNFIQMAFYNGWKKHHGYKYQTLELPNGMCADMYGPCSFRHNDLELLRDSQLNGRLADVQAGETLQFASYGDGIFPIDTHVIGKHIGDTTPAERYENRMMSKIRIANEWDYSVTANLFPFIKWRSSQKIRQNSLVPRYYFVATLLRNAHMCLYEGLTSSYFDCPAPNLFDYFK